MRFRMRTLASLPLVPLTLLLLRVAFVVARTQVDPGPDPGLLRFLEIVHSRSDGSNGVEYGILDLGLIRIIAADDLVQAWITIHWLMLACDIWIWTILDRTWGRDSGIRYLAYGLPLAWLIYIRLDLFSVLLATAGIALVKRKRESSAGVLIALGALSKLWPLVLVAALVRRRVASVSALAFTMLGLIVWMAFFGAGAVVQVVSYRHATGWSVESSVGAILWTLGGGPLRFEQGSQRLGTMDPWGRAALGLGLALVLLAIAAKTRRDRQPPWGGAALAAIGALQVFSPLFSLQYTVWLLPWVATTARDEEGLRATVAVAVGATAAAAFLTVTGAPAPIFQFLLLLRVGTTGLLPLLYLIKRGPTPEPEYRHVFRSLGGSSVP